MFERYTDEARRVIFFSRYEASRLGSPTPAIAKPNEKPASMIETCVLVASAASANSTARLIRSSSAN